MITVWNYKLSPQGLTLTLLFSGGEYRIPFHLEARQSYNLDLMSLLRNRVPDPDGNLIPDNIKNGSALLSNPKGGLEPISVSIAASVYNVRNATCGVQCVTCNGVAVVVFSQPVYSAAVNGTVGTSANVTMNTGQVYTNPSGSQWHTTNTSIATVGTTTEILTGVALGSTEIDYLATDEPVNAGTICAQGLVNCPYNAYSANPQGAANILPCPTTISVSSQNEFQLPNSTAPTPPNLTGLGMVAGMQVSGSYGDYKGAVIKESVTQWEQLVHSRGNSSGRIRLALDRILFKLVISSVDGEPIS